MTVIYEPPPAPHSCPVGTWPPKAEGTVIRCDKCGKTWVSERPTQAEDDGSGNKWRRESKNDRKRRERAEGTPMLAPLPPIPVDAATPINDADGDNETAQLELYGDAAAGFGPFIEGDIVTIDAAAGSRRWIVTNVVPSVGGNDVIHMVPIQEGDD